MLRVSGMQFQAEMLSASAIKSLRNICSAADSPSNLSPNPTGRAWRCTTFPRSSISSSVGRCAVKLIVSPTLACPCVLRKQPSRLTLLMQASYSPDSPFHRSIGEIGGRKHFLALTLRELPVIEVRSKIKVIGQGQVRRIKAETPERMTQPPLPHPLRHCFAWPVASLSLLSDRQGPRLPDHEAVFSKPRF